MSVGCAVRTMVQPLACSLRCARRTLQWFFKFIRASLVKMSGFAQRLVSLWIALTLLATPVPALSMAPLSNGDDHCQSNQHTAHAQSASHHQRADTTDATPDCTHCEDLVCDNGGCADQECSTPQTPTTLMVTVGSGCYAVAKVFSSIAPYAPPSHTAPPLLRPPA